MQSVGNTLRISILLLVALALHAPANAMAAETIVFRQNGEQHEIVAEVLVEAVDGGMLLCARDGRLWTVQPEEIVTRASDPAPLEPLSNSEMGQQLLSEMPGGDFHIYQTAHYVICYNTSETYARWCGGLFEQIYRGFYAFWKNNGWDLPEPQFPLAAVVLNGQQAFHGYARPEIGDAVENMIGYYNLKSNRIVTYDVPNPERKVATLVHEATHQLAYNTQLQKRLADNPYWVSEGLAIFFESPELNKPRGWRSIGRINRVNLMRFAHYLPRRSETSLLTLIRDDSRFRDASTATDAYAEAWALNYYLLKTREDEYVAYLRRLSQGERLAPVDPDARVEDFVAAFGPLDELDRDFLRYIRRLR